MNRGWEEVKEEESGEMKKGKRRVIDKSSGETEKELAACLQSVSLSLRARQRVWDSVGQPANCVSEPI